MSLSWRDRVGIHLAPGRVTLHRHGGSFGRTRQARMELECQTDRNGASWRQALDALRDLLPRLGAGRADATVILSDSFVRYLLVPASRALANEAEEQALVRARFLQTYGEVAKGWAIRLCASGPHEPIVAAAIEQALVDSIVAVVDKSPLRLTGLQPALMAACNRYGARVPPDAWVVLAGDGRLVLGLQRAGRWISLRSRPLDAEGGSLAGILRQELLLLGIAPRNEEVHLQHAASARLDLSGLTIRQWPASEEPGAA